MSGYVKEYRSIMQWEWYTDYKTAHLFRHCILKANYEAKKWRGIEIRVGQFVTSLAHLAQETGLSVRQVRTSLEKLKSTNELTSKTTNQYSIITINNWEKFQANDKQLDKQMTSKRQTNDKQMTTTKESKEYKESKEIKNISLLSEKTKKEDPLLSKSTKFFISEFSNIFGSKPFLSFNDRVKINELSAQYEDFNELITTALQRLKSIDFKDIDYKPSASWLLKGNNFERVMNGEFEKTNSDAPKDRSHIFRQLEEQARKEGKI